ncbi:MAG: hypothetical protein GQ583_05520 [Methyloprofundus sp.]|nr:hypothetical protein [Methyloprofundus sp.]
MLNSLFKYSASAFYRIALLTGEGPGFTTAFLIGAGVTAFLTGLGFTTAFFTGLGPGPTTAAEVVIGRTIKKATKMYRLFFIIISSLVEKIIFADEFPIWDIDSIILELTCKFCVHLNYPVIFIIRGGMLRIVY